MSTVRIKYIGTKSRRVDSVAGTGLVWLFGETLDVPERAAATLLKYTDIWELEEGAKRPRAGVVEREPTIREETEQIVLKTAMPNLTNMTKAQLAQYAASRYGQQLSPKQTAEAMRSQIVAYENGGHARGD